MSRKKVLITIIIITAVIILLMIILNSSEKYSSLSISQTEWNDIIQARKESSSLVLEKIKFNDYNLIIDENKNTIYYSLLNDSKNKYNPDVSFKVADRNTKIAILLDEMTAQKTHNNHEFKIMIYNKSEYHIYHLVCTGFPILNISFDEEFEGKRKNIPIEIFLFNNLSNTPNRITISNGKMKVIDIDKNKKDYVFSLFKLSPGGNKRENDISVFNMDPHNEYYLSALDIENPVRIENTYPVELFINNEYIGLYSLGHNTDKENKK